MKRRQALSIAIAAVLGALAIAALPALAGAEDGHHRGEHHHHHGFMDRQENVGRISAFDASSGQLTIDRFGGGTISGLVTDATEIKCEGRDGGARLSRDGGDNSGPGSGDDNGGGGEVEPGDDHGEGVEPGDENENEDARICTSADLTVGTVVHDVDRESQGGVVSFDEIELAHATS